MKSEFIVKGFHCASCGMLVKDVAEDFPEITSCEVDVKTGKVVVEHKEGLDITKFKKEIESLGDYKII
ncbi:heavy-metal-associated domain-containing protein [Candidatus Woesearchaeota archaeon]|nr:heavy-metal-associated domain-containing protein [Candidatus Woesearchaeota archaeon]